MAMPRKFRENCLNCGKETDRAWYTFCSNACQLEYQYKCYISKWKDGEVSGLQGHGVVSKYIKRYLREKFKNQCCLCSWSKMNPKTKQSPLVADHIDGNWRNNLESNLRLLCPNCDSLSLTYAGLNRGDSRKGRRLSMRAKEAHALLRPE